MARKLDAQSEAILDAAEHIFGWKGYQQATMEMVAREAGVSVGTLYNQFGNKEALYGKVAERIGHAVVERIRPLLHARDPEEGVLDAIRLRLCNYVNDRLFFQPFSFPAYLGIQPEPEKIGSAANQLHKQYVEMVEKVFARCLAREKRVAGEVKMAAYLEGMISAFMGYWSGPLQSDNLAKVSRQMRDMLLRGVGAPLHVAAAAGEPSDSRTIYISRYDLERLEELLHVVRGFGKKESQHYADTLQEELLQARVTSPREVPPDVVTMNSRVRIVNPDTGSDRVFTLTFPKESDHREENVSILSPMGVALFGRRLGDTFTVGAGNGVTLYQVQQILYQPEAMGDYHL